MIQTQEELEKLYTLQESLDSLTHAYEALANNSVQAKAYYDNTTGNLTLENIELTIE